MPLASGTVGNRLLAALSREDLAALRPRLRSVEFRQGDVILKPEMPLDHVLFPDSGVVSLVQRLEDGSQIEVGLVGCEGMVGAMALLGTTVITGEAFVQVAGAGRRIATVDLRAGIARSAALSDLSGRYLQALYAQIVQSAACNGRHRLDARLARWLLMALDRIDGNELLLSHDRLATMLGVRRAGVTEAIQALKAKGLIASHHGRILVRDRPGLESAACECYRTVAEIYRRLFGRGSSFRGDP